MNIKGCFITVLNVVGCTIKEKKLHIGLFRQKVGLYSNFTAALAGKGAIKILYRR
jgi:hypothetical protein